MVISSKYKFIFIHTPKCAGTSIRIALDAFGRKDNCSILTYIRRRLMIPNRIIPRQLYRFKKLENHGTAQCIKNNLPDSIWGNYYKFAFVRNPYDWQVSHYHYIMDSPEHVRHDDVRKCGSFKEYLKRECNENLTSSANPLTQYVCNDQNSIMVNNVGKIENLSSDFKIICDIIGIKAEILHLNRSKHIDYRSYYDETAIELVKKHHHGDLDLFNYVFEP